jgi:hypothetical protein
MNPPTPPNRSAEIALDIALRLYSVRRPLANKAISRNLDIELLSDCVEDARDLIGGVGPHPSPSH